MQFSLKHCNQWIKCYSSTKVIKIRSVPECKCTGELTATLTFSAIQGGSEPLLQIFLTGML